MAEWQAIRLGKIVLTNQSTYSPKEDWQFVNYLDTGNITMNQIDEIQYIKTSTDKLPSRARRKVKLNSIIYSTVRPNQLHYGIIKKRPENFLVSTGFTVIDVDFEKAVPYYIYYALTQKEVTEHLQAIAEQSVSAYPSIKPSDIENLELLLPDRKTQEKIVAVLSSIDEKIKQNNEINNNLPTHPCNARIAAKQRRQTPKTYECLHMDSKVSDRGGNEETAEQFSSLLAA